MLAWGLPTKVRALVPGGCRVQASGADTEAFVRPAGFPGFSGRPHSPPCPHPLPAAAPPFSSVLPAGGRGGGLWLLGAGAEGSPMWDSRSPLGGATPVTICRLAQEPRGTCGQMGHGIRRVPAPPYHCTHGRLGRGGSPTALTPEQQKGPGPLQGHQVCSPNDSPLSQPPSPRPGFLPGCPAHRTRGHHGPWAGWAPRASGQHACPCFAGGNPEAQAPGREQARRGRN